MSENLTIVDHPLVQHKLTLMRDAGASTALFRQLLREISQLLAYETTRGLALTTKTIDTPLQPMDAPVLAGKKLALISILRAGNGLLDGVLELIPSARVGFVGLYRDEETLEPVAYFDKVIQHVDQRKAIIIDPMLATGGTLLATIELLKAKGCTDIVGLFLVASPEGAARIEAAHPDVNCWVAGIDDCLNGKGYILPGLGDAGDKIFGTM